MTTDLEELRKLAESVSIPHMSVDRSTILALVSELEALREAVKPFASVGEAMLPQSEKDSSPWVTAPDSTPYGNQSLTFRDFRRLSALTKENSHV